MDDQTPVFSDAGPLIILGRAGYLWLLRDLFGQVHITPAVKGEALPGKGRLGERAIEKAIVDGYVVPLSTNPPEAHGLPSSLHAGERSTIEAGLAMPAALLLLDDLDARKCAAAHGLEHTGSIGVMVLAKNAGHVHGIAGILESAIDHGLFIAPSLVEEVLANVGESVPATLATRLRQRS